MTIRMTMIIQNHIPCRCRLLHRSAERSYIDSETREAHSWIASTRHRQCRPISRPITTRIMQYVRRIRKQFKIVPVRVRHTVHSSSYQQLSAATKHNNNTAALMGGWQLGIQAWRRCSFGYIFAARCCHEQADSHHCK